MLTQRRFASLQGTGSTLLVAFTLLRFSACGSDQGAPVRTTATGGSGATATGGRGAGGAAGQAGGPGGGAGGGRTGGAGGSAGSAGSSAGGAGGQATTAAVRFEKNVRVNDDSGSGMHTEVVLATGPNGLMLAGWMDFRNERTCAYSVSTDGGATWGKNIFIRVAGDQFVGDPSAAIDADGRLYAVCQDYGLSQVRVATSIDQGKTWSGPSSVQSSPDKPWIGASPSMGKVAFVSWLGGSAGIRGTKDGGLTWGPVHPLEFLNHGTTMAVGSNGVVHAAFSPNGGVIRYARSKNLGDSWDATRTIVSQTGNIHDCGARQNPVVGGSSDPTGQYAVVSWSASMSGSASTQDIWIAYTADSGDTWTKPIKVNDNTSAACNLQAWAAVDARGRVHVAWTDARNGKNDTYYARAANPTQGFEKNVQVTDGSGAVPGFLGDYKGIAISGSDVVVVWNDTRNGSSNIYSARALGAAAP